VGKRLIREGRRVRPGCPGHLQYDTPRIPKCRSRRCDGSISTPMPTCSARPVRMICGTTRMMHWPDGKTDSSRGAAARIDHRIHSDEGARAVEQRSTGIAWIDRGVRLDHLTDRDAADPVHLRPSALTTPS